MASIGAVLKAEITRLAKKEISGALSAMKKENKALRKDLIALRKTVNESVKAARKGIAVMKTAAAATDTGATLALASIRPTGETVRRLREKFGMSQDEFARLTGVGRITVSRWETTEGKINFRGAATKVRFAEVMKFGKTEAWAAIGGAKAEAKTEPKEAGEKKKGRRGRPRKQVQAAATKAPKSEKKAKVKVAKVAKKAAAKTEKKAKVKVAKAVKKATAKTGKKAAKLGRPAKAVPAVVVLASTAVADDEKKVQETRLKTGKVVRRARR